MIFQQFPIKDPQTLTQRSCRYSTKKHRILLPIVHFTLFCIFCLHSHFFSFLRNLHVPYSFHLDPHLRPQNSGIQQPLEHRTIPFIPLVQFSIIQHQTWVGIIQMLHFTDKQNSKIKKGGLHLFFDVDSTLISFCIRTFYHFQIRICIFLSFFPFVYSS